MPAAHLVLLAALVLAAAADVRRRRIPNAILYPAILLCLAAAVRNGNAGVWDAITGLVVCGGLLVIPWLSGALGGGDVKLAALLGAALGCGNGLDALLGTLAVAAMWMLAAVIWNDGTAGAWLALKRPHAPAETPRPIPSEGRALSLAPAALAAAILVTCM